MTRSKLSKDSSIAATVNSGEFLDKAQMGLRTDDQFFLKVCVVLVVVILFQLVLVAVDGKLVLNM